MAEESIIIKAEVKQTITMKFNKHLDETAELVKKLGEAAAQSAQEHKKAAEASKGGVKMWNNLTAGGSKTVGVLRGLNGALHGSTRGMLVLAGMLGNFAGPAGAIPLAIIGVMQFEKANREAAQRLNKMFGRVEQAAATEKWELVKDQKGDVTYDQYRAAQSEYDEQSTKLLDTRKSIVSLNEAVLKARADGTKKFTWNGGLYDVGKAGIELERLQSQKAEQSAIVRATEEVLKRFGGERVNALKSDNNFIELAKQLTGEWGQNTYRQSELKDRVDGFTEMKNAPMRLQDQIRGTKITPPKEKKQKEEEQKINIDFASHIDRFLNAIDRIGGYTSNVANMELDPKLAEMRKQTHALTQIESNTKKTSARYSS